MRRLALLGGVLLASVLEAAPLTDDAGQPWQGAVPVNRLVVLAPHAVDMLLAMGAGDRIVGVVDDHDRRGAHAVSQSGHAVVADAFALNEERLLALRPALVIVWGDGTPPQQQARLKRLGLPVWMLQARTLDDIPRQLRQLGRLTGRSEAAEQQARAAEAAMADLRRQGAIAAPRLRYFYEIWSQPLYSLHGGHLLSQALALCGADNILPAGPVPAPIVNPEHVLRANPDVIIHGRQDAAAIQARWRRFSGLSAARHGRFLAVDDPRLTRPGPGLITAVSPLCAQIADWRQAVVPAGAGNVGKALGTR
ncbi:MAG: ABC transporter substrate-binding protein [Moraxellaceae bacterium]